MIHEVETGDRSLMVRKTGEILPEVATIVPLSLDRLIYVVFRMLQIMANVNLLLSRPTRTLFYHTSFTEPPHSHEDDDIFIQIHPLIRGD